MNVANKLTLMRIVLVFVFMGIIWLPLGLATNVMLWTALIIFIVASFTDYLDGHLARKLNLVTNLGKFMDPLADKMLVITALLAIIDLGQQGQLPAGVFPTWIVVFIILRELMVSGIRVLAASQNIVLAANYWGKLKTVIQMVTIIVFLLPIGVGFLPLLGTILAYASLVLTLLSGFIYLWENRQVFQDRG